MADKLKMHSPDLVDANIERIAELFPGCVTESRDEAGKLKRAIDFDLLRQELSDHIIEGPQERYRLDWPGKREALLAANAPIAKTLRPCREESVDFDTTQNLFIEGDNLDALKLLQETYLGKVKMIYIDPPYNTGNDFIYDDDFTESTAAYLERSNQTGEGGRLVANTESNGKFHSDWLSMMMPRLRLARSLLRDDGIIFLSGDDHEISTTRLLMDEVFGNENFIAQVCVQSNPRGRQSDNFFATVHEYLLVYAREAMKCAVNGSPLNDKQRAEFSLKDEKGSRFRLLGLRQRGAASLRTDRPDMYFPIYVNPTNSAVSMKPMPGFTQTVLPRKSTGEDGRWMWSIGKCTRDIDLLVARRIERRDEFDIFVKDFLDRNGKERLRKFKTLWADKALNTQNGTQAVKALLGGAAMSFPKPLALLRDALQIGTGHGDLVLDFFAGSGTTAHAVFARNVNRAVSLRWISVQLPEALDPLNKEQRVGAAICDELGKPRNIAELTKERIRRAGTKIKVDNASKGGIDKLDTGFRVLKIDTSNMADVYYRPDALEQGDLLGHVANVKPDRSAEDLLFQVLLDWGVDLGLPIVRESVDGREVFFVDDNALAACFVDDGSVDEDFVKQLAARKPLRVVFRDAGFANDNARINVEQIFKTLSPATDVRTL